ncbi:hypothetical protein BG53_11800 [Paenibacillus darwinianus]|uniref:Uncharacterized protein n=1 Tax=Paenibacillus darwinianus TaxID=1380763 RepID=A0A9W5S3S6_9BACL|nr:hypothetical protein [Paenibacillus darwinianus]EXX91273.1 hypothetical protein BG53_11800 [Paenibacillus darwinianus]EXX92217.1 hypothetical protein BG52_15200 [Paenibacillus darwinianus]EXX92821.1 hypothetical protein CH50_12105 [Paenibacillus darwinianus]
MTFKSLDLQMSIPRTPEASAIQAQQLQKQVAEQQQLATAAEKQTEMKRHRNTGVEETAGQTIKDRQGRQQPGGQGGRRGRGLQADAHAAKPESNHPYKGKHIDLTY